MPRRWMVLAPLGLALAGGTLYTGVRASARVQPPAQPPAQPPGVQHDMQHDMPHEGGGHGAHGAAFDWGTATDRDLDVASVFLTARRAGVRAALDTLRAAAARDSGIAL